MRSIDSSQDKFSEDELQILRRLIAQFKARRQGLAPMVEALSPREHEVLVLLASGFDNAQIAAHCIFSEHTAKSHTANIIGKLNAQSARHAVAIALSRHLVRVEDLAPVLD